MKGHGQSTNAITVKLADAQSNGQSVSQEHAANIADRLIGIGNQAPTVFKLYTEYRPNLLAMVADGFDGASLYHVDGMWKGVTEHGAVVEIVSTLAERNTVVRLARAIAEVNAQSTVLVTWQSSHGFESVNVYGGQ